MRDEIRHIGERLERQGYVADRPVATALHLAGTLGKPLLVEGEAGVGKTEIAKVLAAVLGTELIRLQCYEGLDVHTALYEWNYPKQLLRIRLEGLRRETGRTPEETAAVGGAPPDPDPEALEHAIFGREYLLERPLLRAITRPSPPVLLIDEVDRADEEFEAFLLELLSDFQVSIPELGTIAATARPHVVLTSNGTRELSDALRRRCLYLWIDYPSFERELRILRTRLPEIPPGLDEEVVRLTQRLREERLYKTPGVAETLDWGEALLALGVESLDPEVVRATLGCLLKDRHDFERISRNGLAELLAAAGIAGSATPSGVTASEEDEGPPTGGAGRGSSGRSQG